MDELRVARLAELFDRATTVPAPDRAQFVADVCGEDVGLRQELMSLLQAHESSTGFFEDLAAAAVSPAYAALLQQDSGQKAALSIAELEAALKGSYRVRRELGGGMSRVFVAEEIKLGRDVVIKVLPAETVTGISAERFRREIQVAAQLQHAHIVPLLASDSSDRLLYYTMPFVAGETLRARIRREGALPLRDAVRIWRDVLDALAHAHARGVVHRDIKPANILLDGRNALVTDFGIARAIEAAAGDDTPGFVIGTPGYMAPEQVRGDPAADHRVDIYAAGLVMYEMLEGKLPFAAGSARELLSSRLTTSPRPVTRADCPAELAALVLRCLSLELSARPASADELLAELEAVPDVLGATAPGVRAVARSESAAGMRRWRFLPAYALAALVVIAAAFVLLRPRPEPATALPSAPQPSIVVLPLTHVGKDAADAALADGLTQELMAVLARTGNLRVASGTSVLALRERQLSGPQIADSLGASHILEGSMQRDGSRIRILIRLLDTNDGSTHWSETYNREIGDIHEVQEDITRAVATELEVRLGPDGRAARRRYTPDLGAYEWYLRGRSTVLLRSAEGRRLGIEYLDRAIAADSNFAAAHAALVWLYLNSAGVLARDHQEWFDRAQRAARTAVQLDDSLAEARAALGWAQITQRDWEAAETSLRRAIALDPAVYRAYEGLARLYMYTGRPAEQLAAARRGIEADPYSHAAIRELALALNMNNRCDETLELLRPLKSLSPPAGVAGVIMGHCYIRKQMWEQAIAEFRWSMETTEARAALAFLGYALARSERTDEARSILDDLLAGRRHSHGAFGIGVVYAGLRDYDRAFAWLERAVEEHSLRVYIMDPMFEELHRDPRFARLRASSRAGSASR